MVQDIAIKSTGGWVSIKGPAGPAGTTDHGALTGLSDDDHIQYHTDVRGDARYSLIGHSHPGVYDPAGTADAAIAAHVAASDPHPTYTTAAEAAAAAPIQSVAGKTGAVTLAIADTVGLQTALDGKAATGHSHTGLAPAGGTSGQVLAKASSTDYDTAWTTPSGGGGGATTITFVDII